MIKHIQIEHPPTNKCQVCMIAFFTKEDLNNHDRLVHHQTKIRNPLPQKITKNEEKKPEKTPSNKPSEEYGTIVNGNQCQICFETFPQKWALKFHITRKHNELPNAGNMNAQDFKCDNCSLKFRFLGQLQNHKETCTSKSRNHEKPVHEIGNNPKKRKMEDSEDTCTQKLPDRNQKPISEKPPRVISKSANIATDQEPSFFCQVCDAEFPGKVNEDINVLTLFFQNSIHICKNGLVGQFKIHGLSNSEYISSIQCQKFQGKSFLKLGKMKNKSILILIALKFEIWDWRNYVMILTSWWSI